MAGAVEEDLGAAQATPYRPELVQVTPELAAKLLLLITAANGAPIVGRKVLRDRYSFPIDGGYRPTAAGATLFGPTKTIRGVALAMLSTVVLAPILGLPALVGLQIALFAMLGDLLTSFLKRRLGMAPSSRALALDQVPEALLPLVAVRSELGLTWGDVAILTVAFAVVGLVLSRVLFRLRIRERPY